MKKKIIGSIVALGVLTGIMASRMGVATIVTEAEDNCKENGYFWYCEDNKSNKKVFILVDGKTKEGDKVLYFRKDNKLEVAKVKVL